MSRSFDVAIIGAGIVGMAAAMKLADRYPRLRIAVVEKESAPATHQTGHNSGVIHSGIYYRPGSLKARMCVSGAEQLIRFCEDHQVPYKLCGKIVIATQPEEIPRLKELHRRGIANGVAGMRLLSPEETRDIEPHAACLLGLRVPSTGIVDFSKVARTYASIFQDKGGALLLNSRILAIRKHPEAIQLKTQNEVLLTKILINCAGLYADKVARMAGANPPCRIVPIRGEYYQIKPERSHLIRSLIYPVPDPRFPFLGVHFTRRIDGLVEAGPNAVVAWAREGYNKTTVCWPELLETLGYSGFRHMVRRYWRTGLHEMVRSFSKSRFAEALQRLVPDISKEDLVPGGAGVRAQALGPDGSLLDDFVIQHTDRMVHVLNAPSPAATSSPAIADHIISAASPLLANQSRTCGRPSPPTEIGPYIEQCESSRMELK